MISHKYKCIFIHIPRTGGSSIETKITGLDWWKEKKLEKHITAKEAIELYGEDVWNKYFIFSFIRNPWDRMISMYHQPFFNGAKNSESKIIGYKSQKGLKYFLQQYKPASWEQNPPLYHEILKVPNGYKPIDFIGRFENLQQDWDIICSKIGFAKIKLNHIGNRTYHKHYSKYYNEETQKIIYEIFKKDITIFNYKFDTLSLSHNIINELCLVNRKLYDNLKKRTYSLSVKLKKRSKVYSNIINFIVPS